MEEIPDEEAREVLEVFETYGLTHAEAVPIVDSLRQRPKQWIDFMMRFELGLEAPDPQRALRSASTIAGRIHRGRFDSAGTVYADEFRLCGADCFGDRNHHRAGGVWRGERAITREWPWRSSALRTALIGGLAAAAAFGIARLVSAK